MDMPDHEPRIVLNSIISPSDSLVRILLTKSVAMDGSESVGVALRDADVRLIANGQKIEDLQFSDSVGHYLADYEPSPGDRIEIEVSAVDLRSVHSSVIVPQPVHIFNGKNDGKRYDVDGYEYEAIKFTIQDIPNEDNFYEVSIITEVAYTADSVLYSNRYPADWLESPIRWLTYTPNGLAFTDAAFRNSSIDLEVWSGDYIYYPEEDQVKLYVMVKTTTESYYEYMTTYDIHSWNQYPDLFSGEPVPMYSNVVNGFGIFGAYSESLIEVNME